MKHEPEGYDAAVARFSKHFRDRSLRGIQHSYVNLWAEGYREHFGMKKPQWPARITSTILLPVGIAALAIFEIRRRRG